MIKTKNFKMTGLKQEKGEGTAIIAQLGVVDLDGDVTLPGAFGTQEVNIQGAHDTMSPRLGKAVMREEGGYAIADFRFNLDENAKDAREWYSALKFDMENGTPLQEWSYGFTVLDSSFGEYEGRSVRFLKSLKVHEISPVLRGAGIGTGTLSIKSKGEGITFEEEQKLTIEALDAIDRYLVRCKSLADLRAQKGKKLNEEKTAMVKNISDRLGVVKKECDLLVDGLNKQTGGIDRESELYVEFLRTQLKLNTRGVK